MNRDSFEHVPTRYEHRAEPPAAPSPRLRGEGWGEGASPQAQTRGEAPSPGSRKRDLTSPRKRGEVERCAALGAGELLE
jgi:hypothetical protein